MSETTDDDLVVTLGLAELTDEEQQELRTLSTKFRDEYIAAAEVGTKQASIYMEAMMRHVASMMAMLRDVDRIMVVVHMAALTEQAIELMENEKRRMQCN